jgi:hypothetical protein
MMGKEKRQKCLLLAMILATALVLAECQIGSTSIAIDTAAALKHPLVVSRYTDGNVNRYPGTGAPERDRRSNARQLRQRNMHHP